MNTPVCRICWLSTLSRREQQQIMSQPPDLTTTTYLCAEHQRKQDEIMARYAKYMAPKP